MMNMDGMMGGGMMIGMIVFFVILVALIVGLLFALRSFRAESGSRPSEADALAILKGRYARGDIDHDEFEERRRVLQQ